MTNMVHFYDTPKNQKNEVHTSRVTSLSHYVVSQHDEVNKARKTLLFVNRLRRS